MQRKRSSLASVERLALPIQDAREELIRAVKRFRSLVVVGETGSGKTTQLPQFLDEAGFCDDGKVIAITQPRRVAALSVASRVADEMGVTLGQEVGYRIRFEDFTTWSGPQRTRIQYCTDGMLLREIITDPMLSRYSVVVLDEAHERTLHTDILFALVKRIQRSGQRNDLRVIVMSATLEARTFSSFFALVPPAALSSSSSSGPVETPAKEESCPVLYVSGRQYPVEVLYTEEPQPDYLDAALVAVLQLHLTAPLPGDILVFLTGQEEIETAASLLQERANKLFQDLSRPVTVNSAIATDTPSSRPDTPAPLLVTSIYAALPSHEQLRVFTPAPSGSRKVVLATNIAETSITIAGVRYVVDCGCAKVRQFRPSTGIDCLCVVPISKAEAWQRAGRAGRDAPGQCYRLYTEQSYLSLRESIVPEILRTNLSSVVLQLKALQIDDILSFDFMDRPPKAALVRALEVLYALGCLTESGALAQAGQQIALFPLDPLFAKALLAAGALGCSEEVVTIISALSVESPFFAPRDRKDRAAGAKRRFASIEGDHLSLLNVCRAFNEAKGDANWCKENFVNARALQKMAEGIYLFIFLI